MNKLPKIGETQYVGWTRVSFLRIDISQGYIIPFGFGLSYWSPQSGRGVCYPIPLNWIVWVSREIYYRLQSVPERGYGTWHDGYVAGVEEMRKRYE